MREPTRMWLVIVAMATSVGMTACSRETSEGAEGTSELAATEAAGDEVRSEREREGEHAQPESGGEHARSEGGGEHEGGGEQGEHGSGAEEGEESGFYIGRGDTWDKTRRGARLVLSFDAAGNAFVGTVENTTERTLCAVRVEVHLSSGTELGPTERTDLPPSETTTIRLSTAGEAFDTWTAHPEISPCAGG